MLRPVLLAGLALAACGGGNAIGIAPTNGGGGPVDAGSTNPADAGGPDAGPTVPADAGTDGGVADDCSGLVPADAGTPFFVDLDTGDPSQVCEAAQADGTGTIPLRVGTYDANGIHQTSWTFVRAAGGDRLARREYPAGTGPLDLFAQPDGFLGLEPAGDPALIALHRITASGDDLSTTASSTTALVPDPSGGAIGFAAEPTTAGSVLTFRRFDSTGALLARSEPASVPVPPDELNWIAGVTTAGETLVVFAAANAPCEAMWLDRSGAHIPDPFAPPLCAIRALVPLLDGSLLVESLDRDGNPFIAGMFEPRASAISRAPPWLEDVRELFPLPRRRGYALRRHGEARPLEVISAAGLACGQFATPEMAGGPLAVGRDGTLVEQDLSGAGCTFRWYPGLFR